MYAFSEYMLVTPAGMLYRVSSVIDVTSESSETCDIHVPADTYWVLRLRRICS